MPLDFTPPLERSFRQFPLRSIMVVDSNSRMQSLPPEHFLSLDATKARRLFDSEILTITNLLSQAMTQIKNENTNGLKLAAIVFQAPEHKLLGGWKRNCDRATVVGHGIPVVLKARLFCPR